MLDRKAYHQTLPTKRISAGCLFLDEQHRLLVVNPTYKKHWEIPGGTVEAHEAPRVSVEREIMEELGLSRPMLRLLCVDYTGETDTRTESLHFIFYGGIMTTTDIAAIRLPLEELSEFRFLPPPEAMSRLGKRLRLRVHHALKAIDSGQTCYLEEQAPVF